MANSYNSYTVELELISVHFTKIKSAYNQVYFYRTQFQVVDSFEQY